jgi:small ligand-binding sensory domain FIST
MSAAAHGAAAGAEAAAAALAAAGIDRATAGLVFATPGFGAELPALVAACAETLGTEAVVGATAHGVVCGGRDEEGHGVAVLALAGLETEPFLVPDLRTAGARAASEVAHVLGGPATERDLIVLLPDPGATDLTALLAGLRAAVAPANLVGAGAAEPMGAPAVQWCGSEVTTGALAGMALRLPAPPRIGVTQSCQPVSELLTVTRSEGHWVLELDGRPALDVFREVARGPLAADLRRAASFVLVALPRDVKEPLRPGGYLVRHAVGFAEDRRAFALPEPMPRGRSLAFVLRDASAARDDLKTMLDGLGDRRPAFGLYFDCCARGMSLFGVPGIEAAYLDRASGGAPILGMLGSCEIGPIGGTAELLTYTGVLTLID